MSSNLIPNLILTLIVILTRILILNAGPIRRALHDPRRLNTGLSQYYPCYVVKPDSESDSNSDCDSNSNSDTERRTNQKGAPRSAEVKHRTVPVLSMLYHQT